MSFYYAVFTVLLVSVSFPSFAAPDQCREVSVAEKMLRIVIDSDRYIIPIDTTLLLSHAGSACALEVDFSWQAKHCNVYFRSTSTSDSVNISEIFSRQRYTFSQYLVPAHSVVSIKNLHQRPRITDIKVRLLGTMDQSLSFSPNTLWDAPKIKRVEILGPLSKEALEAQIRWGRENRSLCFSW